MPQQSPVLVGLAFVAAIALWIAAAGPPGDQTLAEWIGALLFHFLAALLIRWIYTRKQTPRPRLVSPTLFLIAAGIALLGRLGAEPVEATAQGASTIVKAIGLGSPRTRCTDPPGSRTL